MVTGEDGRLPLPWLAAPLSAALARQRGHALLLQGAEGIGLLHFGLAMAQALLCEGEGTRPCGRCGSCRLVQARLHPDLFVLLPEVRRRETGWLLGSDKAETDKKPSKWIKVEEVRGLIDWVGKTPSRGRGKVALLHPAEAMQGVVANALLKTLEEPPAGTRLLLGAADAAHLIPTVRSRCQRVLLPAPAEAEAAAWLQAQGLAEPAVLLAATAGRPLDALALAADGIDAARWAALPRAVATGDAAALAGWPVPRVVDALHKLCHDAMAQAVGAPPCYFPPASLPARADLSALQAWRSTLGRVARHDEHPWNEGLLAAALCAEGRRALTLAG